jgi:hypothetical protein
VHVRQRGQGDENEFLEIKAEAQKRSDAEQEAAALVCVRLTAQVCSACACERNSSLYEHCVCREARAQPIQHQPRQQAPLCCQQLRSMDGRDGHRRAGGGRRCQRPGTRRATTALTVGVPAPSLRQSP